MLTKNNNFLNNYFTSNEFNFIENMDSNFIFLSQALKNEINNRDLVVKLINGLNDSIYFSGINNKSDENEQKALTSAKNIFELINNNIDLIQSNIDLSNSINNGIVDLLIKIDADEKDISPDKYSDEINNLKNKINDISSNFEDLKLKIDTNNNQISEFFNTDSIKTYIKDFSIELNTEPDNNTTDNNDENSDIVSKTDTVSEDEDNNVLLVSEKDKKVYLPYSKEEVFEYLKQYLHRPILKYLHIQPNDLYHSYVFLQSL